MKSSNNYFKQLNEAMKWNVQQASIHNHYKEEHPDMISILMDEVTLKDLSHFEGWKKKNGYK